MQYNYNQKNSESYKLIFEIQERGSYGWKEKNIITQKLYFKCDVNGKTRLRKIEKYTWENGPTNKLYW